MASIPPICFQSIPATFSSFFMTVGTIPPRIDSKNESESGALRSMEATMACRTNIARSAPEKPRVSSASSSSSDWTC